MGTSASRSLSQSLRDVYEATANVVGGPFFEALARTVADTLGTAYGFVGHVTEDRTRVRSLAMCARGRLAAPLEYTLQGTPCHDVVVHGIASHPRRVREMFPTDVWLVEHGVEAYVGVSFRAPSGEVLGIITAFHDQPLEIDTEVEALLTACASRAAAEVLRLRSDEALAKSEGLYRQIVTTCLEGVWTIDAEGRTTFVNEQLARMLGYTIEEMSGRTLFDFMDDAGRYVARANMERRRRGIAERHEFRFVHKAGHDVWTIMATNPLYDGRGEFVGAVGLLTDVTERRGLELKIQQAQKLESLGVLAGGVAHDFNNLLVGILGNVGLALMDLPLESPATPALRDIQASALRAAELTKQMLAYSGRGRFVIQRLNLNRLVEETVHLLQTVVSKQVTLRIQLGAELPDVEGDASQLRQVLINLVSNANDALGERTGVIAISSGVVAADAHYLASTYLDDALDEGRYVFLEISDTGAGMTQETQAKIFDPFFTTKFPGRGLGLAAVLGILRGHRGAIKVYSEPGKGSTFKVLLRSQPVAPAEGSPLPPPLQPAPPRATGTILVADDEPAVLAVARRVLEKSGFQVMLAADGRAALEVFEKHRHEIHAVLLDMTMPGPSSDEVFRELRRLQPDVRVVLTSGYNEQEATARFVGKGLAGFIQKPWRPADLTAALQAAIRTTA